MTAAGICQGIDRLREDGASLDELLAWAVSRLHSLHSPMRRTAIYERGPDGILRLGPFVGPPDGGGVLLSEGDGVCGAAVATRCDRNIPDLGLLAPAIGRQAGTGSELVVLIRDGDHVFALLDLHRCRTGAFDEALVADARAVAAALASCYAALRQRVEVGAHA